MMDGNWELGSVNVILKIGKKGFYQNAKHVVHACAYFCVWTHGLLACVLFPVELTIQQTGKCAAASDSKTFASLQENSKLPT